MPLSLTALSIIRDGTKIIDRVTWSVREGEHWVILGANGSGKTSLLSAITGYLTPTSARSRSSASAMAPAIGASSAAPSASSPPASAR